MCVRTVFTVVVVVVVMAAADHGRSAVDRTITTGEAGFDVVVATIDLLRQLDIFPDDNRLLRRISFAETRDGVDFETYRAGYDGGIWQVDEPIFLQTQNLQLHPELRPLVEEIRQLTGLDWLALPWNELRRPFFSAMAAALFLSVVPEEIPGPGDVVGQARLWKMIYNSDPRDTEDSFIAAVEELESEECSVRGLDLVFVFDSSGSVGAFNFSVEKEFAVNISRVFNIGPTSTQVGSVAFSGVTYHIVQLDTFPSNEAVRQGLEDIPFNDTKIGKSSTNTSGALLTVRQSLFTEDGGARPPQAGFPRVVVLITDGRSNIDKELTIPAARALHRDGVVVFTVGIGRREIRVGELRAVASQPELATLIGGFDVTELQGVQRVLSDEACRAPAAVYVEEDVKVSQQLLGTVSYFQYELPDEGMTLRLNVATGRVVLYASARVQNPNSALYDVRLETESNEDVFLSPSDLGGGLLDGSVVGAGKRRRDSEDSGEEGDLAVTMIYVTVEGLEKNNSYVLETTFGDTSTTPDEMSVGVNEVSSTPLLLLFALTSAALFH